MQIAGRRVLVTGCSGFIGTHLVDALLAAGAEVYGLTRRPVPEPAPVGGLHLLTADLQDTEAVEDALHMARPEVVFHLAARVEGARRTDQRDATLRDNVAATLSLLYAILDQPVQRVVALGSAEEYAPSDRPIAEEWPDRPRSLYGLTKLAATRACTMFYEVEGLPTTVVKPFLVYGPGQVGSMFVPAVVRQAVTGQAVTMSPGAQQRDFLYVDDLCDLLIKAAESPAAAGEVFNGGTGRPETLLWVAETIVELANTGATLHAGALPYRAGEPMFLCADPSKAQRVLDWRAKVTLADGLSRTVEWARRFYRE